MATKTIYGTVAQDGRVISGSGFLVQRQNDGIYVIDFEPGFSNIPAVVGTQTGYGDLGQNPLDGVIFPYINQGAVTAITAGADGRKQDRQFSFIAIGEE
ncbi:hypothetical protein AAON49_03430 [Pseudotenacibaculum sp. MALMAid0570]|uniref:hypothetical protein n=1 Tax=Pseudotenacibaculum sp. MALMAid0570 TaxID=3143938 RepID=UPI0032DEE0B2